jgi:hypothetical protein
LLEVSNNQLLETPITVTFTPLDDESGTWTSAPAYVFGPQSENCAGPGFNGNFAGKYKAIGDAIFAYNVTEDSPTLQNPYGSSAFVRVLDDSMTIAPNIATCKGITFLKRAD